jgi:poly-gamma-glutamate synthesis protein (capsule biosynthesis protein)
MSNAKTAFLHSKWKVTGTLVAILLVFLFIPIYLSDKNSNISTIVVPHHNLVANERSELFNTITDRIQNRKIILLSTNHYDSGVSNMQTRRTDFTTANGTIQIDDELVNIAVQNGVSEELVTFETEHGVKTLLPDIATYASGATVLPLIIKEDTPKEDITNLITKLHSSCPDCLVVASVDFSHYQPYLLSELHDDLTRRAMQALDKNLIENKSEIGEPQVLSAAIQWAELSDTNTFVEQNHTNASEIENNYYAEGTTHFFGWYEEGNKSNSKSEVTYTFVGDVMFDRNIRERYHPKYYDAFSKLGNRVLWGTDIVMANLEGPITTAEKVTKDADIPVFTFSPLAANTLRKLHFTDMATRNNHILDAGEPGLEDTKRALSGVGIGMLNDTNPKIIEGHEQRIIIYTIDATQNDVVSEADLKEYQGIKDNIIVYVHWGPEYETAPSASQRELAHTLINNGADMVVGVGPHVIQPAELYKNRLILYSLGNFFFDMTDQTETSTGLVLTGKFTEDAIVLQPMLTENIQLQPVLLRSKEADAKVSEYFKDFSQYQTSDKGGIQFTISK